MDWHKASRTFSLFRVCVWLAAIPTAYLFGWLASVSFVALCSLYANLASDYASWRADVPTSDPCLTRIEEKLDRLLEEGK